MFFCRQYARLVMFKPILFSLSFLIVSLFTKAQTGKIIGKIVDAKTGETLPGATILIEGTSKGASCDFDGNYTLSGIPTGKCTVIASYITYDNKKLVGVEVKPNDVTTLNITLDPSSSQTLVEVVVQAEMNKENTNAVLMMQKNNASVSDGISSESIKKTPDRTTSDVIKRISGATIQDNKFAIIRGMSDRYNAGFINGAPLPSSESDKKAFSFDIFPANLLDNIIILKTATPDLPGDFAGGVIQINTKSIPEKNAQSLSIGGAYNAQTTSKKFQTYKGGQYDWLGIDDGTRAQPKGIPTTAENALINDNLERIEQAKKVNYDWSLLSKKAMPNFNFQYSLTNVGKIFKRDAGSIFALTYNNTSNTFFTSRREFEEGGNYDVIKTRDYTDTTFSTTILASALWNVSYKLNSNHQLGFKNLFSINSDDRVIKRKGSQDLNTGTWEKSSVRWFTQNQIYSGQLNGDHYIEKAKMKLRWVAGYSDIKREIPNLRRMTYVKTTPLEDDDSPYTAVIATTGTAAQNAGTMLFNTTNEKMQSVKYDISKSFKIGGSKHELQIGGNHIFRDRVFNARLLGYSMYRKNSSLIEKTDLKLLDESVIFSPENIGIVDGPKPANGGFKLSEATTEKDNYTASSMLNAAYVMADSRFFDKLRLIYGARVESYRQTLNITVYNTARTMDNTVIDVLPSVNAVYSVTDKTNIRLSYYKTVSRPEFRELAPFNFLDFNTGFTVSGDTSLTRAKIDNYDARFEWYPGAGQMISISGFYKRINDAIEQSVDVSGQLRSLTFKNVALVENIGAELEYRFKLSTLFCNDSSVFLSNTTLFTNFAYIQSKVDVSKILDAEQRPLQGQSPYIINAGIQYLDHDKGWGISASYNVIGRRIVIVGSINEPSYWENPRHVLDLQLMKTFKQTFEIKFNARDLFAQNQIWYQDINQNGKLDKNSEKENKNNSHSSSYDNIMANTKLAPTLSLSFSYKF